MAEIVLRPSDLDPINCHRSPCSAVWQIPRQHSGHIAARGNIIIQSARLNRMSAVCHSGMFLQAGLLASIPFIDDDVDDEVDGEMLSPGERSRYQRHTPTFEINERGPAVHVTANYIHQGYKATCGTQCTRFVQPNVKNCGSGGSCNPTMTDGRQCPHFMLIDVNDCGCQVSKVCGVDANKQGGNHLGAMDELIPDDESLDMRRNANLSNGTLENWNVNKPMMDSTNTLVIPSCGEQLIHCRSDAETDKERNDAILHNGNNTNGAHQSESRINYSNGHELITQSNDIMKRSEEYQELTTSFCYDMEQEGESCFGEESIHVTCASMDSLSLTASMHHQELLDFAAKYFNVHFKDGGSNLSRKLKGKNSKKNESVSLDMMVTYNKAQVITAAHTPMFLPEHDVIACNLFKDICKYTRGSYKSDPHAAAVALQSIIATVIDKSDLRDEIYCQLMRQSNENPSEECRLYTWNLLAACSACFVPSEKLRLCLKSHLLHCKDPDLEKHVAFCLKHLEEKNRKPRKYPPSTDEIMVFRTFSPLMVRVYFPDEKIKLINVHPTMTIGEMVHLVTEKVHIQSAEGWAVFENYMNEFDYIKEDEYVADIVASWEKCPKAQPRSRSTSGSPLHLFKYNSPKTDSRRQSTTNDMLTPTKQKFSALSMGMFKHMEPGSSHSSLNSTSILKAAIRHSGMGSTNNNVPTSRFMLRKRFINDSDLRDPVAVHLLYHQAVHSVTEMDCYDISLSIAQQLAGLQAQVTWGPHDANEDLRYADACEHFFPKSLQRKMEDKNLNRELPIYHMKHGKNLSNEDAMLKYINICLEIPLFGSVSLRSACVSRKPDPQDVTLAVHRSGIKVLCPPESTNIICSYHYYDIENVSPASLWNDGQVVMEIRNHMEGVKVHYLELEDREQFISAVQNYSPGLVSDFESLKPISHQNVDLFQVRDSIEECRISLVCAGLLQRPPTAGSGKFLKSAFRRIHRQVMKVDRNQRHSVEAAMKVFDQSAWTHSKAPFTQAITAFKTYEEEEQVIKMLNPILFLQSYSNPLKSSDHLANIQMVLASCLDNKYICNELYLQLIRQTTYHPEPQSDCGLYHWRLLVLLCCTVLPAQPLVLTYLQHHLVHAKHGTAKSSDIGEIIRFCSKCLQRTKKCGKRCHPPSLEEMKSLLVMKLITTKIWFSDNSWCYVQFDSAATVEEICSVVKAKIGMKSDASGFHIVEVFGLEEVSLIHDERLADSLYKWENLGHDVLNTDLIKFVFKKRLFLFPFLNPCDPVECEVLRHQLTLDIYAQKIPVDIENSLQLCALIAQADHGPHGNASVDYSALVRILPLHVRDNINTDEIEKLHKDLVEVDSHLANLAFIDVLKKWHLFGATHFTVKQSQSSSLPETLWMVVLQTGLRLLPCKGQEILCVIDYKSISSYTASSDDITITVRGKKEKTIVFQTDQSDEIVLLMKDYMKANVSDSPLSSLSNSASGSGR